MKNLVIYGKASQKEIKTIPIYPSDFKLNLMAFLQANEIPVASSCRGEAICLKCMLTINDEKILSCQVDIQNIFKDQNSVTVIFSYL